MPTPPRRPWYQFSLRTMFVAVIVVSIPLAWVGYSLNWIRQRHEAADRFVSVQSRHGDMEPRVAPAGLWLFGEEGVVMVFCSSADVELARRLFPEANISAPLPDSPPPN